MKWRTLYDSPEGGNVKTHICGEEVASELIGELGQRFGFVVYPEWDKTRKSCLFEPGGRGSIYISVPNIDLELSDGRVLQVIAYKMPAFESMLRQAKQRVFPSGRSYYKLHSFFSCLVIEPEIREQLLFLCLAKTKEVNKLISKFFPEK